MRRIIALAGAAALLLTACGTSAADRAAQSASNSAAASGGGNYPVDIVSCGQTLHFDAPPSRVLVLGDTSVSNMDALGQGHLSSTLHHIALHPAHPQEKHANHPAHPPV